MAKIKLLRSTHFVADQRDPYLLKVSRVPCVGETIFSRGTSKKGVAKAPGVFVVTSVMHHHDVDTGDVVAEVGVDDWVEK